MNCNQTEAHEPEESSAEVGQVELVSSGGGKVMMMREVV
jgi:hypothetical protein